ncbi:uroporphyrinogen-III synthase [uncultured Marivita sp.]|uniref:uroporphyrinogen-III synthase n=1 Tax=uncultured Marivita sp. TaxID=888080 RepID=UPI002622F637|nr:uroporphyrinogen-III synthase [uncultured Marivita sp.]
MRPSLEKKGYKVSLEPVSDVSSTDPNHDALRETDIFVVTSVYASLHLINAGMMAKTTPIYAVGPGTAAPLRKAGFSKVFQAEGDAKSLLSLILKNVTPTDGTIFYISGQDITADIAQLLVDRGYDAKRVVVYEARPSRALSAHTQDLLRG